MNSLPSMYGEFAGWFHLLTPPSDYEEEAEHYHQLIQAAGMSEGGSTLLELGSGGGNNASHLKQHYTLTLTDLSPEMLALSQTLNPECEHLLGDMRTLRLGRTFDVVFAHDSVMYLTTEEDLRAAIETAYVHCRPGGIAIFAPDHVRETFAPWTSHGGDDGEGRGMRYLMWVTDPDPDDTTYVEDFAYLFQEDGQPVRVAHDRHIFGVFPLATWERLFTDAGFAVLVRPEVTESPDPDESDVFVVRKPGS